MTTTLDLRFASALLGLEASEEQIAFVAQLMASAREGHFSINIEAPSLPEALIDRSPGDHPLKPICQHGAYYYLQKYWIYETRIVKEIKRLISSTPISIRIPNLSDALNTEQKKAVLQALEFPLSIISGGPGTGKTYTAAHIVKAFAEAGLTRIILTAPTGKAAFNLESKLRSELASYTSGTLHSLLGIKEGSEESNLLHADLIIVDECSMIDGALFAKLLKSIPTGARLILIGDHHQLPPVEAGTVFADLMNSSIPIVELTTSLRSDRLEILSLAQKMKEGNAEGIPCTPLPSFKSLWQTYKDRFPSYFDEEPVLDHPDHFRLLSCVRKGPFGVDAINHLFVRQYFENAKPGQWWVAPILIVRNDPCQELFNGDIGLLVRKMSQEQSLAHFSPDDYVLFPDKNRKISALALPSFEYGYCLSVHKSQGSEYDEVVILVPPGSEVFGREVLYTAVTRAKKSLSLLGDIDVIKQAVENTTRKMSGLSTRLN